MGTLRAQKERTERDAARRREREWELEKDRLDFELSELSARLELIQRDLEQKQRQRDRFALWSASDDEQELSLRQERRESRQADDPSPLTELSRRPGDGIPSAE